MKLFEILIVLSIFTSILFMSIGFLRLNNSFLVSVELERLYFYLLYMQNKAKIEKKDQSIVLKDVKLTDGVLFGFLRNSKGPPSDPKYLINKPITFKDNKIMFYKDGTISSGIIYLIDKNYNVMYALTSGVSDISYLRRYKYNLNNWSLIN